LPQPLTIAEALDAARELLQAGRLNEASQVCSKILEAAPNTTPAMRLLAMIAFRQGNAGAAVDLLRGALRTDPQAADICNDLGSLLAQLGHTSDAMAAYRDAIRIAPDFAEAHNNLANLHQMSGELTEAVACYHKALELRPAYAEAHRNLASALRRLGRLDEAVKALETAVSLNPDYTEAVAQLVHQLKQLCDWRLTDKLTAQLIAAVSKGEPVNPFVFISLYTTPSQQLQCARQWAAAHLPACPSMPARAKDGLITVGYLSADYQEHATVHLIGELFALHDRTKFRVIGYSYGRDDGSAARRRVAESFDAFVDLERLSHADAAARIQQDGVDILVDLKGYTADARPEIVALRPAPIQVSYLGYPGTMGTDAVDYILVDPIVAPPDQQPHFTEKLVHLPDCYQMNDRRRPIASVPSRAHCGLPETGFVFCCLSAAYKITAPMFEIWVRLLEAVPGSVLWLLDSGATANANLRREADARLAGAASRLLFAPSVTNPKHLARLAVADLFLDTLPYNAHTVASDALWAGCPVVTCTGATFPSRVAGSLLHAAGLPELVTTTLTDYEALALRLARNAEELQSVRMKLQSNRLTAPLFDSVKMTRNIEAAYGAMCRR
jgi:protein O-GlcNAc transferase